MARTNFHWHVNHPSIISFYKFLQIIVNNTYKYNFLKISSSLYIYIIYRKMNSDSILHEKKKEDLCTKRVKSIL